MSVIKCKFISLDCVAKGLSWPLKRFVQGSPSTKHLGTGVFFFINLFWNFISSLSYFDNKVTEKNNKNKMAEGCEISSIHKQYVRFANLCETPYVEQSLWCSACSPIIYGSFACTCYLFFFKFPHPYLLQCMLCATVCDLCLPCLT